jgi:hypothetical protein
MDLPLTLQMEIDISADAHKREIAEGFAKAREKLLPAPTHDSSDQWLAYKRGQPNWLLGDPTSLSRLLNQSNASANPYVGPFFGMGSLGNALLGTAFR